MKNKIIIGLGIGIVLVGSLYIVYQNFFSTAAIEEKEKQRLINKYQDTAFTKLPTLNIEQLDSKIKSKENFVAYFSWVDMCGDARLFQANLFNDYLDEKTLKSNNIYVIDLDELAPDALANPDLRKPLTKKFLIDTWTKDPTVRPMSLKSPQLVHYKAGKIIDLVSWTVKNSDATTGMRKEYVTKFFDNLNN